MIGIKGPYRKRYSVRAMNMEPTDTYPSSHNTARVRCMEPAPVNTRLRSNIVTLYVGRAPFSYRTRYMDSYRLDQPYSNYRRVLTPCLTILDDDVEGYRTSHSLRRRACFWISSLTLSSTNHDHVLMDQTWTMAVPFKVVNFKKEMRRRHALAHFRKYHERISAWNSNRPVGVGSFFGGNIHKACKKAHMRRHRKVSV